MANYQKRQAEIVIPHNREAEEAVLGSLFIDPDRIADTFDVLVPTDFYIHRNGWIYEAMIELFVNAVPIDLVTVSDELDKRGRLKDVGGAAYLTSLVNQSPTSLNLDAYVQIVLDRSQRRLLLEKANETARLAYDEKQSIEQVSVKVDGIWESRPQAGKSNIVGVKEAAEELVRRIQGNAPQAVTTGLPNCDLIYGGYPREGETMITADSSTGKTALVLQGAEAASKDGERVLYFTFEHSPARMVARRVFANLRIPMIKFRQGNLNAGEKAALAKEAEQWMKDHPNIVFDYQSRSLPEMRRSVRQSRPDLIIVDDLTHISADDRAKSETKALLDTATWLKDLSILDNRAAAVVTIHHITSEEAMKMWPGGKKPTTNIPPSLDSLTWAKDLRYIVDLWIGMVLSVNSHITSDHVDLLQWVMKDRDGQRLAQPIELHFHKEKQMMFDNTNPMGKVTSAMPSVKPVPVP